MKRPLRIALLALPLVAAPALVLLGRSLEEGRRREELLGRYERVTARIREAGALGEAEPRTVALARRTAGLARELTSLVPIEGLALESAVAMDPEQAEAWLEPLDGWFEEVDAIFAELALHPPAPERCPNEVEPKLMFTRYFIVAVGLRVVTDVRQGVPAELSARRLAGLLDVMRVQDGGNVISGMVLPAAEHLFVLVLRTVLEAGCPAAPLREVLEPRLASSCLDVPFAVRVGRDLERFERAVVDPRRVDDVEDLERLVLELEGYFDTSTIHGRGIASVLRLDERNRTLARLALALHVHHELHGTWPWSLDELAALFDGEVPRDPGSGEPVPYLRTDRGALLGPLRLPDSPGTVWPLGGEVELLEVAGGP